jgi:HEAT repeat protein
MTTYAGPTDRLREHVTAVLAGKEVALTASITGPAVTWPAGPAPRDWLRGQKGRVGQLRASAKISYRDDEEPLDESAEFVAWGIDKDAVPKLVESLRDKDAFVRCEAAEDLGQVGRSARDALPALRLALADSDAHVRVSAALALARIDKEDRQAVPALLAALEHKDEEVRTRAAGALAELAPRAGAAVPALLAALSGDADATVRATAALALGRVATEAADLGRPRAEVIAALTKAVRDDKVASVRRWAIDALRRFGVEAKAAIPAIKARVKGRKITTESYVALEALSRMGPVAVPALCDAMKQAEGWCPEIIACLEDIGPPAKEAVPGLRELLKSYRPVDRTAAVAALMRIAWGSDAKAITESLRELIEGGWLGGPAYRRVEAHLEELGPGDEAALPAILAWLKAGHVAEAASIIARLGPGAKDAVPALRAQVDDRTGADPEVAYALWRLGYKREAVTALRKRWEATDDWREKAHVLCVLADVGPDAAEVVPLLGRALRKEPENYRESYLQACVALALWRVQKPLEAGGVVADPRLEALNVVRRLLRDDSLEAIEALGQMGPEAHAAVPDLLKALKHRDREMRDAAAVALGRMGVATEDVIGGLSAALKDRNSVVRAKAAIALVRLGKRALAVPVMADVIERRPSVVRHLADTLIDLGPDAKPAVPALLKALGDDDRGVYLAAARVLRRIDPQAADRAGVP